MKRLALVVVLLCAGLAGAAFTVPSNAASVAGHQISQSALNSDLSAIDSSPAYQCYLQASALLDSQGQATLPPLTGVGQTGGPGSNGIYDGAFVRYWLSKMINGQIVANEADARHITVTTAEQATARTETEDAIDATFATLEQDSIQPSCSPVPSGKQVLASLPVSFVDTLAQTQATSDLLAASTVGSDLTPASMAQYFDAHSSDFDTLCVDGFALSSSAAATSARAAIAGGTPFAGAAPSGTSVQTACFTPSSASYQPIQQALGSLPIGGVSQPLAGASGTYYLFQLTSRTPSTLAASRGELRGAIVEAGLSRADTLLVAASKRLTITVDPRYGGWTKQASAVGLLAPLSPPPSTLLSPSANVPGATSGTTGVTAG